MPSYFAITCYRYIFVLRLLVEPLTTVIYVTISTTYVPHTGTVDYFEKWISTRWVTFALKLSYSFHTTQYNVDHMETSYYLTEHFIGSHKKLLFICDIQKVTRLCIIFLRCREKEKKKGKRLNEMKTPRETDGISPQVTGAKLCLKILPLTAKQMSSHTNSH